MTRHKQAEAVVVVAQIRRGQTPRVAIQVVLVETEPHLLFLVPL
jgi:hypothetical protein